MHSALDKMLAPLSKALKAMDDGIEELRARLGMLLADVEQLEDAHLAQENEKSALDTLDDFRDEVRRISGNRMLTVDECLEWMKDQAQNVRTGK